jgi:hypothetical protein
MPLYDFQCPHGHRFEHFCPMADRLKEIPCEGRVNQMVPDEIAEEALELCKNWKLCPDEIAIVGGVHVKFADIDGDSIEPVAVTQVPCMLKAKLLVGPHSNPRAMLDHGMASNRDAAREGRYDPLNPNRRFISKGRNWRP